MTIQRPDAAAWDVDTLFIDGSWRSSTGTQRTAVYDCATEEQVGSVVASSDADLEAAVQAARHGLAGWSALRPAERATFLRAWCDELRARTDEMIGLVCAEVGTAVRLCGAVQVESAIAELETIVDLLSNMVFETEMGHSRVVYEAVGVVGAITPWNYPLFQATGKIGAALAAGCTVVHKPSSLAPLSLVVFAQAAERAGLPPGVYNLITGAGRSIDEALARHPGVAMISFTGSTLAGVHVYELAAHTIKRVTLELGGKSASILLDDASVEAAVRTTVNRAFLNSGQTCDAWTRLLVPRQMLDQVLDIAVVGAERLTVGDPFDERTRIGPLVSEEQAERVRQYIDGAVSAGARVATGGSARPPAFERGHYVSPTVLRDVTPDMTAAREEIFGPVLVVMTYENEDDAAIVADATDYGLSSAVWSADKGRAVAFARRLHSGQVVINGGGFDPLAPFGGVKMSGIGRELGAVGIQGFLEPKALVL